MNERGQTKCEISVIISQCFLFPGCSSFFPAVKHVSVGETEHYFVSRCECECDWWFLFFVTDWRPVTGTSSLPHPTQHIYICASRRWLLDYVIFFYVCTVCVFYFCVHCVSGRRCRHKVNSSRCLYLCFPLIHLSVSSEAQFEKPVLLRLCVCLRVCLWLCARECLCNSAARHHD